MSFRIRGGYFGTLVAASLLFVVDQAGGESRSRGSRATEPVIKASSLAEVATSSYAPAGRIVATREGAIDTIAISTLARRARYSVSRLESPPRLVIDIKAENISSQQSVSTDDLSHVSGVRVGQHGKNSRVVVDLKSEGAVDFTTAGKNGAITLTLQNGDRVSAATASTSVNPEIIEGSVPRVSAGSVKILRTQGPRSAKASALTLDEEVLASGGTSLTVSPAAQQAKLPEVDPRNYNASAKAVAIRARDVDLDPKRSAPERAVQRVDLPKSANERERSYVSGIGLESAKGASPSVVVGVKGNPDFALNRTAPSEYVLTLRDAGVSDLLRKQTLFSSTDSGGIRSVRAALEGNNTLVRVFADSSSYLTARRSGDSIVIEETQDLSKIAKDIRAQMVPDKQGKDKVAADSSVGAASTKDTSANPEVTRTSAQTTKEKSLANKEQSTEKEQQESIESTQDSKLGAERKAPGLTDKELLALRENSGNYSGRLISLDLQEADIDSALRIIAEVSNLNIVAGDGVNGKVTLKLVDVPWDQALDVILKSHGLDKVVEGNVMRVASIDKLRSERESLKQARVAEEELESLGVKYMRVSYAKASEIKALVETVLSERGSVAFDERSNQLIVKDVRKGLQNVSDLVKKIDLRTPQILLETQIVEAKRDLTRQLGAELGFQYIQSPATGNGTGLNFPASIAVGGSVDPTTPGSILGSAFPVAVANTAGSAVTMLFDSADGTKNLQLRLSQLEEQGDVRVISKPAVATTNNKPAEIKSVTKIRVKLPNGGLSIATGSGAQSSGSGDIATQTIEAGIVLNVTPQASPDYYILLDIKAKSSTFGKNGPDGIPEEIERSASSSVLVSSGQTFALGGIYKISQNDSISGVPFFKDIPFLGTFFRSSTMRGSDEELLFFITPRIVEGSFEDASLRVAS
jgi:type IV pilus secretin PilQ/predicted competence protein